MLFLDFKKEAKQHEKIYLDTFKRVLHSGWYILGNEVKLFEEEFAKYLGVKHAIGVANGLEALQISLMASGVGKGDEVITTPLSAVATTLAIMAVDAKPVFVDIKPDGQIDETLIEAAITKKTKAIMPVHLYGNACAIDQIKAIAEKHQLLLIEDAAQAQGSEYDQQKLGSIGQLGCFSFYPTKNLGAFGDAGAIVTNNKELADKCRQIRDYGQSSKYVHTVYGLNSRLDELQAAFLRDKLKRLDADNLQRINNADIYRKMFADQPSIKVIEPITNSKPNYHQFVIKVKDREKLQQFLKQENIPTLIHYPLAIPDQPLFKDAYKNLKLPVTATFIKQIVSLPCGPYLTEEEIKTVANKIIEFYHNN